VTSNAITFVGLDVHKNTIQIALLPAGDGKAVEWTEAHSPEAIRRLGRRLRRECPGEIRCCYEAGPPATVSSAACAPSESTASWWLRR
jgi:hypothetical protein